jgi:hypothetical protein
VSVAKLIIQINSEYKVAIVQHTTEAYREPGSSVPCIVGTSNRGPSFQFHVTDDGLLDYYVHCGVNI